MLNPIYASKQHEVIVESYITMIKDFIEDVSNEQRWSNFLEVLDVVVEYHNNYGEGRGSHNYWDWLMILPINLSVLANGYLAAIETKRNAQKIRSYKIILSEMVIEVVNKIEKLQPIDE